MFAQGIILGFSIAAPVGPIGVLCIRRTLAEGKLSGLLSGLGAATADAIYGAIAGLGLTAITRLLVEQQTWLQLVGGLFLCYLGIKTLLAKPLAVEAEKPSTSLPGAYVSTFLLTLSNPLTILSFTAVFAGLGVGQTQQAGSSPIQLVAGVFAGSALWWMLLSGGVGLLRDRFTPAMFQWVNWGSGVLIIGFGVVSLGTVFMG